MNVLNWRPIEEFDKGAMDRKPVFVHDPKWWDPRFQKANIAQAYWDKYLNGGSWSVCLFESCSAYAWVPYYSKDFKPKYFAEIPDFELPDV